MNETLSNAGLSEGKVPVELNTEDADVLPLRERYSILSQIGSVRMNAYGRNSQEDEISILLPTGETKGFFKAFAPPLAPFLTLGRLSLYSQIHKPIADWIRAHPSDSFEDALNALTHHEDSVLALNAKKALLVQEQWTKMSLDQPAWLKANTTDIFTRALETDRHLTTVIKEDEIEPSASPAAKIAHTAAQLHTAFGIMSPLYTVEALLDNKREDFQFDPIRKAQIAVKESGIKLRGNNLEALFEAATHCMGHVFKKNGVNSKNMDWETLEKITQDILSGSNDLESARILSELTWKLGSDPVDVMFALWKRNSNSHGPLLVPISQAQAVFEESLQIDPPTEKNETIVYDAQQLNAVVRFKGDTPAQHTKENFSKGDDLVYGSVCDTVRRLEDLILSYPDLWTDSFRSEFEEVIKPQMNAIPSYSSAKGRLLLELLMDTDNAVKPEFKISIEQAINNPDRINRYLDRLTALQEASQIRPVGSGMTSPKLIGGKAAGQEYAVHFLTNTTPDNIPGAHIRVPAGIEVTTEAVEAFLQRANPQLFRKIMQLDQTPFSEHRDALSQSIHDEILNLQLTPEDINRLIVSASGLNERIVVRSSAADEAIEGRQIKEHAGFYESKDTAKANMLPAILEVIASYYNPGGIAFRDDRGLGHSPKMALLIQNYFPQTIGGNFLVQKTGEEAELKSTVTMKASGEAADITSGRNHFTYAEKKTDNLFRTTSGTNQFNAPLLETLDAVHERLFKLQKRSGIVEWGAQGTDIMILQQQMYPNEAVDISSNKPPFPDKKPLIYTFADPRSEILSEGIKTLESFLESYVGPVQLVFPDNPDQIRIGSEFRALCIRHKDKIQSIKIISQPPSETSHLGCFILSRFPWLQWNDIWVQ